MKIIISIIILAALIAVPIYAQAQSTDNFSWIQGLIKVLEGIIKQLQQEIANLLAQKKVSAPTVNPPAPDNSEPRKSCSTEADCPQGYYCATGNTIEGVAPSGYCLPNGEPNPQGGELNHSCSSNVDCTQYQTYCFGCPTLKCVNGECQ